jgi:hypothetical protein
LTEQERIDRETLLRRAVAVAGAVYVAPLLTASAAGSVDACSGQRCRRHRKCRRMGGVDCKCVDGRCRSAVCPCTAHGRCDSVEECGQRCRCEYDGHGNNPGRCIYEEGGLCDTFQEKHGTCPGGEDSECGEGKVCWTGCCQEFGYPPLCAECCSGR